MERIVKSQRLAYIDFMNIAACFGVISLHCSGSVHSYGMIEERLWILSMCVQTIAHYSIPVFFMITGTTLLEYRKKYDTRIFFRKRFLRVGIPFFYWTIIYMLLPMIMDGAPMPGASAWRDAFLSNGANNIFWFFYTIFGIYFCMPVFSLIAKEENFKTIEYLCIGAFITVAIYPAITRFIVPIVGEILPTAMGGYIGYVFIGWLILHENFSKKVRCFIYGSGIVGAVLMFAGTWHLSAKAGSLDSFFMEYNSIACFPMSVAVMLFGKNVPWEQLYRWIPERVVTKIASAGLGIYVIHMIFIRLFDKFPIIYEHPMYITIFGPIGVYLLSLGAVLILQKVPLVKHIIP